MRGVSCSAPFSSRCRCDGVMPADVQAADVVAITTLFFGLVLLAATQDIAVDGWALTLLSRRHVG